MIKKALVGLFAGFISGFFSTGGGMILVPAFVYLLDVPSKKARGTSIFCILMMVITSWSFVRYWRCNWWFFWFKITKKIT